MTDPASLESVATRRARARRTALVLGIVAVAVYACFILAGVLAR